MRFGHHMERNKRYTKQWLKGRKRTERAGKQKEYERNEQKWKAKSVSWIVWQWFGLRYGRHVLNDILVNLTAAKFIFLAKPSDSLNDFIWSIAWIYFNSLNLMKKYILNKHWKFCCCVSNNFIRKIKKFYDTIYAAGVQ